LQIFRAVDHQDPVEGVLQSGFDQQRNHVDLIAAARAARLPLDLFEYQWVEYRLQAFPVRLVSKDPCSEPGAIQRPVGRQYRWSEHTDNLL
jgi:hypothetical protein